MADFLGKNIYRPLAVSFLEKSGPGLSRKGREGGMTLLEALIALSLFAFMFVFVAQAVRQGYRQTRKLKSELSSSASFSHVLDLMRRDFQGAAYFLDINNNFKLLFREEEETEPVGLLRESERERADTASRAKAYPVLLSPYFVFEGKRDEIQFVSYSFSGASKDQSSAQWIKIRYFFDSCLKEEGFCLFRSSDRHWRARDIEKEPEESFVLMKNLKSLEFSYASSEDLLEGEWREEWSPKRVFSIPNSPLAYPQQLPFPSSVKIKIGRDKEERELFFPVSYSYLRDWNPYSRAYPGFPLWTPPSKKPKKATTGKGRGFADSVSPPKTIHGAHSPPQTQGPAP